MKTAKQPRKKSKASKRPKKRNESVSRLIESIAGNIHKRTTVKRRQTKGDLMNLVKNLQISNDNKGRYLLQKRYAHEEIIRLKRDQEIGVNDEFGRGFFNGMELCLSVLEGREPKYLQRIGVSVNHEAGRPFTEEEKQRISEAMKKSFESDYKVPDIEAIKRKRDESAFIPEHWGIKLRKKYLQPGEHEANARIRDLTAELETMFPEGAPNSQTDINGMTSEEIAKMLFGFIQNREFAFPTILHCFNEIILNKLADDSTKAREEAAIKIKRFEEALTYLQKNPLTNHGK